MRVLAVRCQAEAAGTQPEMSEVPVEDGRDTLTKEPLAELQTGYEWRCACHAENPLLSHATHQAPRPTGFRQTLVSCHEVRPEPFGQGDIPGVIDGQIRAQLPDAVAERFEWILNGPGQAKLLAGGGCAHRAELATQDEHPQGSRDLSTEDGRNLEHPPIPELRPGQLTGHADDDQRIHED
jgi:hypothetical protein